MLEMKLIKSNTSVKSLNSELYKGNVNLPLDNHTYTVWLSKGKD
jgi:hypothetical protein